DLRLSGRDRKDGHPHSADHLSSEGRRLYQGADARRCQSQLHRRPHLRTKPAHRPAPERRRPPPTTPIRRLPLRQPRRRLEIKPIIRRPLTHLHLPNPQKPPVPLRFATDQPRRRLTHGLQQFQLHHDLRFLQHPPPCPHDPPVHDYYRLQPIRRLPHVFFPNYSRPVLIGHRIFIERRQQQYGRCYHTRRPCGTRRPPGTRKPIL